MKHSHRNIVCAFDVKTCWHIVVQTFIEKSISVVRKIQDMNISWQDRNISI